MSGTLFSKTSQRNSRKPPHIAASNKPQGDGSAPPPSKGGWLCDEPYKYSTRPSKYPLEKCNEIVQEHDENMYRQLKEEINFLMVVAGLFLAIVAAFTIESYKFLQEDKQDTMSDLLVEVVRLLNDTSAQGKAKLPKPFTLTHYALVVNQLWFLSMILDLIAVAMGTFCLQWISAISRGSDLTGKSIPPHESLVLRQLRHEGLVGWGVRHAPEALLLIVQLSIGLFTCSLLYFLWNVSERTTIPALVATGVAGALLCLINLLPFLQPLVGAFIPATLSIPECPFKSPTSWLIQSSGSLLLYILKLFLNLLLRDWVGIVGRPGRWLESLPLPFTDFNWKMYDRAYQHLRASIRSPLSYFESGLVSALDHFPYGWEAKDIIFTYLENLLPVFEKAQDWEKFSQQDLSNDEKAFLNMEYRLVSGLLPPRLRTVGLQLEHASRIKADFLSALVLQQLTGRHSRLVRPMLQHRVELYIRVKNSTEFISRGDGFCVNFGQSLDCPCQNEVDVAELDPVLRFQFLHCVRHLFNIRRFNDLDIMTAVAIIQNPVFRPTDPPAEEECEGLLPNQSSPGNTQIGDLSNQPDPGATSSPPNNLETGGAESVTHDISAEDHQFKTSFEILCHEVRELLLQLRPSDFKSQDYYRELEIALGLPVEPKPPVENVYTGVEEV